MLSMVMVGMFILRAADMKKPRLLVRDGVFRFYLLRSIFNVG